MFTTKASRFGVKAFSGMVLGAAMLAAPHQVAAADDGGLDFVQGTIGQVSTTMTTGNVVSGLVSIQVGAPSLWPAMGKTQNVRWAPVIQQWNGQKWVDLFVGTYSPWTSTGIGMFGAIPAVFPSITKQFSLPTKGTYFFRVGYYAQWQNTGTARFMNRIPTQYQGMASHVGEPWFTYYRS